MLSDTKAPVNVCLDIKYVMLYDFNIIFAAFHIKNKENSHEKQYPYYR